MPLSLAIVHADQSELGAAITGDVDSSWTAWLESSLACLLFRRFERVVLDVSAVGFCDLEGARVMLRFKALAELDGVTLSLAGGGPAARLLGVLVPGPAFAPAIVHGEPAPPADRSERHLPVMRRAGAGPRNRPRRPRTGPDPVHPAMRRAMELSAIMRNESRIMCRRAATTCSDMAELHERLARMHELAGHTLGCDCAAHRRKAAQFRDQSARFAVPLYSRLGSDG
ncbi:STAS domain-containing protein [Herbidospora daliensis]|uniref:STAS domain-containing protein n=1 Tax=Herbidospora daliensis TaxID=295585 RepID=UPI0007859A92|nr:hypothetical protein [Herbidospora daliensis]